MTTSRKKPLLSKLVYIHELDSVRNSDAEIERARKCLYDEILINGNTPVISFNQLTDSRAFLGLITESAEKAHEAESLPSDEAQGDSSDKASRDSLLNMEYLMREGRIKIVRFKDKRTASQYLQDNLDPKRAQEEEQFILSGWPIPYRRDDPKRGTLIESIRLALRNSDPDYLDRHSEDDHVRQRAGFGQSEAVPPSLPADQLRPLKQLVEFMLFISKTEFAYTDINPGTTPRFATLLKLVTERIESGKIVPTGIDDKDAMANACVNLRKLGAGIQEKSRDKINNRSAWHKALRESSAVRPRVQELSFAIVDLCYNLKVESGIDRCSHFMNPADEASFDVAVGAKLGQYAADYVMYEHTYQDGSCFTSADASAQASRSNGLDWSLAVSIQRALSRRFEPLAGMAAKSGNIESYGSRLRDQRAKWRRDVYGSLGFQTLGAFLYVVLFAFIEVVLSLIDNLVEGAGTAALASDAPGIEDMFTFNRTIAISVIFLVGVIAYTLLTKNERSHSVKVPIAGVAAIFFVIMPVLACIDVAPVPGGMPEIAFEPSDFIDNFVAMLPSLLVGLVAVIAFASIGSLLEERTGVPALFDSMRLTKASVVDAWKFWRLTRAQERGDASLSKYCEISLNPWKRFRNETEEEAASSPAWRKYVELVKAHDRELAFDPALEIILDEKTAREFTDASGRAIGIIHDSPFSTFVVDLVRDSNGHKFAYERLIPKAKSGVVIVPKHDEKFVLLDQFRHAIRRRQLAFPRGFGEERLSPVENACKELSEELNLATPIEESDMMFLGKLTPDSGISANIVSVFWCEIGDYAITEGNEGILDVCEMSEDELRAAIARGATSGADGDADSESIPSRDGNSTDTGARTDDGMGAHAADAIEVDSTEADSAGPDIITDGFTLAAFAMWECSEGRVRKKRRCRCPRRFLRQKP